MARGFWASLIIIFLFFGSQEIGYSFDYDYLIIVNFTEIELALLDGQGQRKEVFPVALPRQRIKLPVEGRISFIIKDPWWRPTRKTREAYWKKHGQELPSVIEPNDPRNAMGVAKIIIEFITPGINPTIRIHGTNREESIGKRISRGCIRMLNKDILCLTEIIEQKEVKIIFR